MNTRRSGGSSAHHVSGDNSSSAAAPAAAAETKPDNYPINAKICRLVAQYPCMYDRSNPQYLQKDVVGKAWVKIAKEMNDSIASCKERWRNIRTSFARSINVNKIPASANRTKPYYLHEELKFLAQHITPGVPVPRRGNKSFGSFGDESQEIKISMSEESFDSFAAITHDAMEEEAEDSQSQSQPDEESSSTDEPAASTHSNSRDYQTSPQNIQIPAQTVDIAVNSNAAIAPATVVAATTAIPNTNAAEVAPMMVQPVCPCPPKKRQRLVEIFTPDIELTPSHETDVKLNCGNYSLNNGGNTMPGNGNISTSTTSAQQQIEDRMNRLSACPDIDFDDAFLQGLRPEMKAMNFHQKLYFKRRVYDVLGEIFPQPISVNGQQDESIAGVGTNVNSNMPISLPNSPLTAQPSPVPDVNTCSDADTENLLPTGINLNTIDPNLLRRLQILLQPQLQNQQPLAPPIISLPKMNTNTQTTNQTAPTHNSNSVFQYGSANSAINANNMPPRLRTLTRLNSNMMRLRLMGAGANLNPNSNSTPTTPTVNGCVQPFQFKEETSDD